MEYLFIALIWIMYCFIHSFMISIRFTAFIKRTFKEYYAFYRLFYVVVSIILLIPVLYYSRQWSSEVIFNWRPPWSFIRYAFLILSMLIFVKSFFFDYDSLAFIWVRQALGFNKKVAKHSGEITKSGLLGIVRHPMYLATIIFLWCMTFRLSDIVVNTVLTAYVIIGTLLEERKLVLEFGESYIQYQKEVPMLIPFWKKVGSRE